MCELKKWSVFLHIYYFYLVRDSRVSTLATVIASICTAAWYGNHLGNHCRRHLYVNDLRHYRPKFVALARTFFSFFFQMRFFWDWTTPSESDLKMLFKVNVTGVAKPLVFEFALQQQDGLCGNPGTVSVAEIKSAVAEAKVGGEEKRRAYIIYGRRLFTHVSEYRVYTLLATPWYSPTQSVRVESWLLILHLRITPHFNNIFTLPLSCAIFPASTPSSSFLPSVLMSFCVYQVVCASTGALGVQTINMCWWSLLQNGFHVTYWRRPSASSPWIRSLLKN